MEKKYEIGQHVVFVDPYGQPKDALVTQWWGAYEPYLSSSGEPGCNLLYVSGDTAKDDPYGRQIERSTSVVHKSKQAAHGNYWRWPNE